MNNFSESYEVILKTLKTIEPNINFLNQIRIPKLADIELIAVSITAEYLSIDSERLENYLRFWRIKSKGVFIIEEDGNCFLLSNKSVKRWLDC